MLVFTFKIAAGVVKPTPTPAGVMFIAVDVNIELEPLSLFSPKERILLLQIYHLYQINHLYQIDF